MKKQHFLKFLSLAISICLLVSSLFTGLVISAEGTADVWDGTSVSESLSGSGTYADPYIIQSGADLKYWSNKAAGGVGYSGQYFLLTNDIDLGDKNLVMYTFSGTLDGNGHEIKGLKVVYNTLDNVGFFRTLSGGTVKNLTVTGSVWGKSKVGGFAGTATNATLLNCVNNVTVKAEQNSNQSSAGGFIGYSTAVTMSNCVNNGSITAKGTLVGGMIGNVYPSAAATINIVSCVNNGDLSSTVAGATSSCAGGFVGNVGANATVNFLYSQNNGSVTTGATDVAGFVGTNYGNLKFDHCINEGTVSAYYAAGGFIGWNRTTSNTKTLAVANCINVGKICATRADGGNGWIDGILGVHTSSQNKSTVTQDKVYFLDNCLEFGTAVNNQATADTTRIGIAKALSDFTADNIESLLGFLYVVGENGPEFRKFSEGNGTKADPYVLKTKEDLLMLSLGVTVEQLTNYTDASFELGNDIDLEGDTRFVGIGNGYKSFQGDFDGKGYTVSGVDIKHAHLLGLGFFGLIGGTNERKITNLNVKGNVTSTATTNTHAIVGGLVGKNSVKLTISNCSFDGTVYSTYTNANYSAASGIICEVAGALDMVNCYVLGKIDGFGRGGSLVGSLNGNFAVNVTNCYSTAEVTGIGANKTTTTPTAGGLIGFIGTGVLRLNNCFFAGTAPAERSSGMGGPIINHHAGGTFEYENVYYLADSASEYTTYNVGVNKTAAQFKDGTVLALLNANGLVFAQGENYPILMTKPYDFADLTADGVVDTADAVVILRHIESVEELGEDAFSFADINGDGDITEADYFTVKYFALVGIVVDEPEAASWSTLG